MLTGCVSTTVFFFAPPKEQHQDLRAVIFRADLRKGWDWAQELYNMRQFRSCCRDRFHLCGSPRSCPSDSCSPKDTANFCHVICYKLAKQRLARLGGCLNGRLLCQIAWLYRPIVLWRHTPGLMNLKRIPSPSAASSKLPGVTPLRELLRWIDWRLPQEIQNMIFSYVSGPLQALVNSLATLSYVENQLAGCKASEISYRPFFQARMLHRIGIETVDVLGEICLKRIGEVGNPGSKASQEHEIILYPNKQVEGVQVAIGTYGVVDLRVIYRDSSTSSWINKQQRKWITTYKCSDLKRLHILSDVSSPLRKALLILS